MKCDRCGKPSVYHSTLVVNGVSTSTNLCRDCAIKEGVFNSTRDDIFDNMFSIFDDFLPLGQTKDIICPVCKTTLREFRNTGKLGCANCYNVFKAEIDNAIKRIAPFDKHKQEISAKKIKTGSKGDKIAKLKEDMAIAVKEERYEDAAKIKKQIAKLEASNE